VIAGLRWPSAFLAALGQSSATRACDGHDGHVIDKSEPIYILPIGGTWWRRHIDRVQWLNVGSLLHKFILSIGFDWLRGEDGETFFDWDGRLQGHQFWRRWWPFRLWTAPELTSWFVAGDNLYSALVPRWSKRLAFPGCRLHLWGHSHAINPIMVACAKGLKVNVLVTFCSPVRYDPELAPVYAEARKNIGYWIHFYSDNADKIQIAGELGDGQVNPSRLVPMADDNRYIPGGHSGALNDPRLFKYLLPAFEEIKRRHGRPDYLERRAA
jgi:hypothetical protein